MHDILLDHQIERFKKIQPTSKFNIVLIG